MVVVFFSKPVPSAERDVPLSFVTVADNAPELELAVTSPEMETV